MSDKISLRTYYRAQRQTLSASEQIQHALTIAEHLQTLPAWPQWQHIGFYWAQSTAGELCLQPSLEAAWAAHKQCYLPRLIDRTLEFVPYTQNSALQANRFGIPEPLGLAVPIEQLEVLLLPLVAFDDHHQRLGMGGGFYDQTLATCTSRPFLVGIAHECQRAPQLPTEPWDIPLDIILTETGVH